MSELILLVISISGTYLFFNYINKKNNEQTYQNDNSLQRKFERYYLTEKHERLGYLIALKAYDIDSINKAKLPLLKSKIANEGYLGDETIYNDLISAYLIAAYIFYFYKDRFTSPPPPYDVYENYDNVNLKEDINRVYIDKFKRGIVAYLHESIVNDYEKLNINPNKIFEIDEKVWEFLFTMLYENECKESNFKFMYNVGYKIQANSKITGSLPFKTVYWTPPEHLEADYIYLDKIYSNHNEILNNLDSIPPYILTNEI